MLTESITEVGNLKRLPIPRLKILKSERNNRIGTRPQFWLYCVIWRLFLIKMKIIFENADWNTFEKQDFAKENFPNYRMTKKERADQIFEILIDDFPIWLRDSVTICSSLLYDDEKLAENCKLISGKIPFEWEGNYLVECERIERFEGEIIQRVWITFLG